MGRHWERMERYDSQRTPGAGFMQATDVTFCLMSGSELPVDRREGECRSHGNAQRPAAGTQEREVVVSASGM